MSEPDAESYLDYYRATWSLFVALEKGEKGDQEAIEGIWREYGEDALLRGWHIVAARLRQELQRHAHHLECDCGSDEWLERERPSQRRDRGLKPCDVERVGEGGSSGD